MKCVVLGSTGGIGRQVVVQALAAGHDVTAVARRPEAITFQHERLTVLRGDAMQPETLAQAVTGQDVVFSALGVSNRQPTTLYSAGVANIMQAMKAASVRRIMCISASGLDPGVWWQRWFAGPMLWLILKEMYTDLVRMETAVKASDLDWTIIRPPRLSDKPRTGRYQIAVNHQLSSGYIISRADVADYMVNHADDSATYRAMIEIAY
jgi:putative NADH-flavin reductase